MADNTDNRDGQGGEELPDDLKRLVDAAEEDAADAGEQDIEQALANKIDIMATNTNVLPGGEVPFMVVFYSPPDNAAEFGVKVIDARIPPEKEKK